MEASVFAAVLLIVGASFRPGPGPGSNGNVEQWINLTNSMFYGSQDLLFTYGPLFWITGGATTPYSVVTFWSAVLFVSVANATFWALIVGLCHRATALLALAVMFFLFFAELQQGEVLLLLPLAMVAYFDFSTRRGRPLSATTSFALGSMVALLSYVRFMFGFVALATFLSYQAYRVIRYRYWREPAFLALGLVISYLAFGLAVFHEVASLSRYVVINGQLSLGNSTDMRLDVEDTRTTLVIAVAVALGTPALFALRRRSLFLTSTALLLIYLKLGFGRSDHFLKYFVVPAALVVLLLALDRSKLSRIGVVALAACLYVVGASGSYAGSRTMEQLSAGVAFTTGYDARMSAVYESFRLDDATLKVLGDASVDAYPYNNEYIFANELTYRHRPLFQSYMTLTPKLDRMNEEYLMSDQRPRYVLWSMASSGCLGDTCNPFEDFDQKYVLNEDPRTTSALLVNYHFVLSTRDKMGRPVAVLEANREVTPVRSTVLRRETIQFGQWLDVPQMYEGLVRLAPQFTPSAYGRIKRTLLRGSIVKVHYRLANGEEREYRLNVLNASSGVIAQPLLDELTFSGPAVAAMKFETTDARAWRKSFAATWIHQPSLVRVRTPPRPRRADLSTLARRICEGSIDSVSSTTAVPRPGPLIIRGWLADSASAGLPVDDVFLTLTNRRGDEFLIAVRRERRTDVAEAYRAPSLEMAGFSTKPDLSGLHGDFTLGLGGAAGNNRFACSQFRVPIHLE